MCLTSCKLCMVGDRMQQKLFNFSWYDPIKRIYYVEGAKLVKIYENPDGTIKKTVGMSHARNGYETNHAKTLALMIADRSNNKFVPDTNRLPVLYKGIQNAVHTVKWVVHERHVMHWNKMIENYNRLGFNVRETHDDAGKLAFIWTKV